MLLRDGFEVGGDGAEDVNAVAIPDQAGTLSVDNLQMLDLSAAWSSDGRILELARISGGNGETIRIQTLRTSGHLLVRLLGSSEISAWTTINAGTAQLAVGLADQAVLLVGGADDLQVAINAMSAQIWTSASAQ